MKNHPLPLSPPHHAINGEVDITIADYSLPIASLPDADPLLTMRFTPTCTPTPGTVIIASVRFSREIVASFGDVNGLDVTGITADGSVAIQMPSADTPTATPTSTPTPGPGTPSATTTATPTPTVIPATSTPRATTTVETPPTAPHRGYLPLLRATEPESWFSASGKTCYKKTRVLTKPWFLQINWSPYGLIVPNPSARGRGSSR